jgi:hypothetical protein
MQVHEVLNFSGFQPLEHQLYIQLKTKCHIDDELAEMYATLLISSAIKSERAKKVNPTYNSDIHIARGAISNERKRGSIGNGIGDANDALVNFKMARHYADMELGVDINIATTYYWVAFTEQLVKHLSNQMKIPWLSKHWPAIQQSIADKVR